MLAELDRPVLKVQQAHGGPLDVEESARRLLREALTGPLKGQIALVSSFGADSAVLLHLVAEIDQATPILFLDTAKLFGETLRYSKALAADLGLTNLNTIHPDAAEAAAEDPDGILWSSNPDACCALRKTRPLKKALEPFAGWITGRKRYQGAERLDLSFVEWDAGRLKFNPLANWTRADLNAYRAKHNLRAHPLEADGFRSIGCMPCTDRVAEGEDERAGRWRGQDKVECGIHRPADFDMPTA
jgi:phosphoadenosine phosphosulfate reductase